MQYDIKHIIIVCYYHTVHPKMSGLMSNVLFQHQIIYYLCVLLKDPSEPNAVSSVVPLFQVRMMHNVLISQMETCFWKASLHLERLYFPWKGF